MKKRVIFGLILILALFLTGCAEDYECEDNKCKYKGERSLTYNVLKDCTLFELECKYEQVDPSGNFGGRMMPALSTRKQQFVWIGGFGKIV